MVRSSVEREGEREEARGKVKEKWRRGISPNKNGIVPKRKKSVRT